MKRVLPNLLRVLMVAAIVAAAAGLVSRELSRGFDPEEFVESLHQTHWAQIALAIVLLGVNYVFLMGYDFLGLKYIGHPLPLGRLALASVIGHASSFNFGSLFGGAAARYRLYSAWRLSPLEILELIAILGLTFWLGVLALAGIIFLVDPFPIPPTIELRIPPATDQPVHVDIPFDDVRPLAILLLAIVAGYLLLCAVWRRPLKVFRWKIPLPHPWLSLAQIGVSCADLVVAALIFYVLFPAGMEVSFLRFMGIFLLAWVIAVLAHVPAAAFVLEAVVLALVRQENSPLSREEIFAALFLFRIIYYLLPLTVAGLLFLGHEVLLGREVLRAWRRGEEPSQAAGGAAAVSGGEEPS
jgi:uncharacterized membrane protein YbhN (UPF0104 family)